MKNNWVNEFETKSYIEIPNHGKIDLKPYVWGVSFYEPVVQKKENRRVILYLDAPRQDKSTWQSDDPDMQAIYDTLYSPMLGNQIVCILKPPSRSELAVFLRRIGIALNPALKNGSNVKLVKLEWWVY